MSHLTSGLWFQFRNLDKVMYACTYYMYKVAAFMCHPFFHCICLSVCLSTYLSVCVRVLLWVLVSKAVAGVQRVHTFHYHKHVCE